MKTSKGTKSKIRPGEGGVGVGGSRARRGGSKLEDGRRIDGDEVDGNKVGDDEVGTKVQKSFESKKTESGFFTPGTRKAFTELR